MNFEEAEKYLFSLGNEVDTMKLGLANITLLLNELGTPQNGYLKVQVAGTNGKGSVCAFLNSICLEAGIRTGMYTSPHLISIRERIKIDGADVCEKDFAVHASRVRETSESLVSAGKLESVPTFFEQVTAIGLLAFAEAKVDLAILETGLGGRFDATTAASAEVAAITRIDLDHQEYLGDTIEKIAAEKAAIIRGGSEVVLSRQDRSVEQVLVGRCREVGVEPVWASTDIRLEDEPDAAPVLFGSITTERAHYGFLELWNMLGRHQFENAAVAIGIAEVLTDFGLKISTDQISIGVGAASHPGRLEEVAPNFLLDGAHNPAGAAALADFLDESYAGRQKTIIFGAMKKKAVGEMLEKIAPKATSIILTRPANSRAFEPHELMRLLPSSAERETVTMAESVEEAIGLAASLSRDRLIVVTGSLYLVGEAKRQLEAKSTI